MIGPLNVQEKGIVNNQYLILKYISSGIILLFFTSRGSIIYMVEMSLLLNLLQGKLPQNRKKPSQENQRA